MVVVETLVHRLLVRGLKLLVRMAYLKTLDKNVVTMFRQTVDKYPERVMFVNANDGTEWTYSKVFAF